MELSRQKIILGISIAVALETGIGSGTVSLTNAVSPSWIPTIQAWMNILAFFGSTIVTMLAGASVMSSPSQATLDAMKKAGVVILAVTFASMWFNTSASAQLRLPSKPTVVQQNPFDPIGDLSAKIEAVKADTVTKLVAALMEADADAGTVINATTGDVKDPISHACYPAQIKFLQSLPSAQPIQSPAPFNLIVLFQRKRDFVAQVQAGLPSYLKLGCSAMLGDEISIFVKTLAMAGVKVGLAGMTGLFPVAAPLTLPALSILP